MLPMIVVLTFSHSLTEKSGQIRILNQCIHRKNHIIIPTYPLKIYLYDNEDDHSPAIKFDWFINRVHILHICHHFLRVFMYLFSNS